MERRSFTDKVGAFTVATLLSRIFGYVRDALVAAYFGGGMVTDAFYAAFKVPNLLRRFLGEGAMTAAFVPIYTELTNRKGKKEASDFLNSLYSGLVLVLVVIVTLGIIFAPVVTRMVAWGFVQYPEKLHLTTQLVRLTFPFLIFISMSALVAAVLNSNGHFFIPAISPSGLSLATIVYLMFLSNTTDFPVHGLALSAVMGGAIHFFWQMPTLWKDGIKLRLVKPFAHPAVKSFFLLLGPTVIGLCADQINAFVDQLCASFLGDGAITALYNSNRIMQLPLALFGIAVSNVALPSLSKFAAEDNHEGYKDLLNFSLRLANFVLIPSAVGLIALGIPIIRALFEHGRFTGEATMLAYKALVPYTIGLPAYSAVIIMGTAFYAKKNTKTPVKVAFWTMGLHVIANLILMQRFQVGGLALSTAVSAWFQCACLFYFLRQKVGALGGRQMLWSFVRCSAIGIVMGIFCYFIAFHVLGHWSAMIQVPVTIVLGSLVYFGAAKLLGVPEFQDFLDMVLRRKIES